MEDSCEIRNIIQNCRSKKMTLKEISEFLDISFNKVVNLASYKLVRVKKKRGHYPKLYQSRNVSRI